MPDTIEIGNDTSPPRHRISESRVGKGGKHENLAAPMERNERMVVRIGAYTPDCVHSKTPLRETIRRPDLIAIERFVADGVTCLVDTGATISLFRSEVAVELGFHPDDGIVGDGADEGLYVVGGPFPYLRCQRPVYLQIGPYPISVNIEFPVARKHTDMGVCYEWAPDVPSENILGMRSVLDKRMLCFTPDFLYAFEHYQ